MAFSRFAWQLVARVALLFALLAVLAAVLVETEFWAVAVLVGGAVVAQGWQVIRFVNRSNAELTRFLGSIRHDDFSQSFAMGHLGKSFVDLQAAFEEVMERFRAARSARETQQRYLEALVEHVPVAITALHEDGRVALLNNAARRLLDAPGTLTLDRLAEYGARFRRDMSQARPGERQLTRTELDGVQRQLIMSTTQISVGGDTERLISLQDIQQELDATELSAWQDMVRVLSHEIGNSITPIASLARTAEEMVVELEGKHADRDAAAELVGDIHDAVNTITRRSEGLMRFVESYRKLTHLPLPQKRELALDAYVSRLEKLLGGELRERGVTLHTAVPAKGLVVAADESLLDQAVINVVRNAADAASSASEPQVWLGTRLSERGRPIIEVCDNGEGFDEALADKIFSPFFTTKADGSGIGLSIARQIMLMHKGAITAHVREGGGALFELRF